MKDLFSEIAITLSDKPCMPIDEYPEFFYPPPTFQEKFSGSVIRDAYLFGAAFCNILADEVKMLNVIFLTKEWQKAWNILNSGCGRVRAT